MKQIISLVIILLSFTSNTLADHKHHQVEEYVQKLTDHAFEILRDKNIDRHQRINISINLLEKNLDLNWMANFALGFHRRSATNEQINKFIDVYKKLVLWQYAHSISGYQGEKFRMQSVQQLNEDEFVVKSKIARENNRQDLNTDFLVRKFDAGDFKVFDIVTEGISYINSQRSEFNSFINTNGLDALIEHLLNQVKQLQNK